MMVNRKMFVITLVFALLTFALLQSSYVFREILKEPELPGNHSTKELLPESIMTQPLSPSNNMTLTLSPWNNLTQTLIPNDNISQTLSPSDNMTKPLSPRKNTTQPVSLNGNMTTPLSNVILESQHHEQNNKSETLPNLYITLEANGRLGNQMFEYAALRAVSHGRKWVPVLSREFHLIHNTFNIVLKLEDLNITNATLIWDNREDPNDTLERLRHKLPVDRNITLMGYFQSYRFFENINDELRKEFTFKANILAEADRVLQDITPKYWQNQSFTRVGIHVRRTDKLDDYNKSVGYDFPNVSYYSRAMDYFLKNNSRVQFVVASDDIEWCQQHLNFQEPRSNIYFLKGNLAYIDMAILTSCNHVITTFGTFSWWIGWLSKGQTVYYKYYPRPGSTDYKYHRPGFYYPSSWIPME